MISRSVSVVVPTLGHRPRLVQRTLASILQQSTCTDFELVVVDQGGTQELADIVAAFAAGDPRVRLVRDNQKGASRARNFGAANTSGEFVVFVDDDCEAEPEWLGRMVAALREDPTAGIACGAVIPGPCDPQVGFMVGYLPPRRQRLTGRLAKLHDGGIGGNMALRRAAFEQIGGFDEMLGAGAYFPAMEDQEITYRALAAGYALQHLPDARVVHHGMREWRGGGYFIRRTFIGVAAAYMKHARLGDGVGVLLLLQQAWLALENIAANVARRRGPFGFGRFGALFVGVWRSFELEVEPGRAVYRSPR